MGKRTNELELENSQLCIQLVDHQKQMHELKSDLVNKEKAVEDSCLQQDLEKDELLCQVLSLQKEVSCLSSSSLAREKETIRKELDKTKLKLKDTDAKLKNTIQDKIKLESEKAQVDREIKQLLGQRSILERDIRKRDSLIDRNRSKSFDISRSKGPIVVPEQILEEDYQNLEDRAIEMENEITYLKQALMNATGEKEDIFACNGILRSQLEAMTNKFNIAQSEINFLKEEIGEMGKRLDEYESICKDLNISIELSSREKEEMAMQLTDALLEVEAEKSTWSIKEKALSESNEKVKVSSEEIVRLSRDIVEVRHELESSREQCRLLRERLTLSEETAEREKQSSMEKSSENDQLKDQLQHYLADSVEFKDNLKSQLLIMTRERDDLLSQSEELKKSMAEAEIHKKSCDDMLSNLKRDAEELMRRLHNEALMNNKEKTKLRLQLRSTQAKSDAFCGRYMEKVDEIKLMNKKFKKASTELKEQIRLYGYQVLELQKQLVN